MAAHTRRRDGPTGAGDRAARLGGRAAGNLTRRHVGRDPERKFDRALRGVDRPAAGRRPEHAGEVRGLRGLVAGGRSDRHRPPQRLRSLWDATAGKLLWHKLVAPAIDPIVVYPWTGSVGFSADGKLVFAAAHRMDWITHEFGFIVFYEAGTGRTVREIRWKEKPIRWAALAPDGRMLVVGSDGSQGSTQFSGIESEAGRTRWTNPPEDQTFGFYPAVGLRFVANSHWFLAALRDGNVIRLNCLTGHEQRRFLADWRTPQQKNAGRPSDPSLHQATFSPDGRTLVSSHKRVALRMGR